MYKFLIFLVFMMCSTFAVQNSYSMEYRLQWEVVQPFRLFRNRSDHAIHEWAFDAITPKERLKNPVSAMEKLLNDPGWWEKPVGETEQTRHDILIKLRRKDLNAPPNRVNDIDPKLGWASFLRIREEDGEGSIAGSTCWDAEKQSFKYCRSEITDIRRTNQYMQPFSHLAHVWLEVSEDGENWDRASGICRFETNTEAFISAPNSTEAEIKAIDANCGENQLIRVRYDLEQDQEDDKKLTPVGIKLSVYVEDQLEAEPTDKIDIKIRDYVVAAMGDSFASGEGNPEVPAHLDRDLHVTPDHKDNEYYGIGIPARSGKNGTAKWSDRRCHRSLYAAPARAAIALALHGDRHNAITFVSFACSGAEITSGLLWPQDSPECVHWNKQEMGRRLHLPQVGALVQALGPAQFTYNQKNTFPMKDSDNNRYLISDNDRYFEEIIKPYLASKKAKPGHCKSWPSSNTVAREIYLSTAPFSEKRKIDILFLSIGGNDMGFAGVVANRTLGDEEKIVNRLKRWLLSSVSPRRANTVLNNRYFFAHRFRLLDAAIRVKLEIDNPSNVILSLYPDPTRHPDPTGVKPHIPCASDNKGMNVSRHMKVADLEPMEPLLKKLNEKIEELAGTKGYGWTVMNGHLEAHLKHGVCAGISNDLSPDNANYYDLPRFDQDTKTWDRAPFLAYVSRHRWFRTPNDAFQVVQFAKKDAILKPTESGGRASGLELAMATLGGPFHPTAEGLAHTADKLFCAAAKQLGMDAEPYKLDCQYHNPPDP